LRQSTTTATAKPAIATATTLRVVCSQSKPNSTPVAVGLGDDVWVDDDVGNGVVGFEVDPLAPMVIVCVTPSAFPNRSQIVRITTIRIIVGVT
jgi:hypothetical protein